MSRGSIVAAAIPGDYRGRPRPALVVQSDLFGVHASVTVAPITSTIVDAPLFRITLEPSKANGLRTISQVMVDKLMTVKRERLGQTIGRLDDETLGRIGRALALWLGIA